MLVDALGESDERIRTLDRLAQTDVRFKPDGVSGSTTNRKPDCVGPPLWRPRSRLGRERRCGGVSTDGRQRCRRVFPRPRCHGQRAAGVTTRQPSPERLRATASTRPTSARAVRANGQRKLHRWSSIRAERTSSPSCATASPHRSSRAEAEEIRRFDQAIDELDVHPGEQAVFRFYQGAPGCGKTSLLQHLRDVRSNRLLFIGVRETHLASEAALVERVREVAVAEGPTGTGLPPDSSRPSVSRLRMQESGNELRDAIATKAAGRSKVVLYMDEAQLVGPTEQPGLVLLHRDGLGVPAICLFSGLSHTSDRFRSIPGLSRGWPQHLHGAQTALCHELLRTNGALNEVDSERLRAGVRSKPRGILPGPVGWLRPRPTALVHRQCRRESETASTLGPVGAPRTMWRRAGAVGVGRQPPRGGDRGGVRGRTGGTRRPVRSSERRVRRGDSINGGVAGEDRDSAFLSEGHLCPP